ncbi:MAG: TusE/DsrC/DsvC family sulfur relay protein [Marinoscillum sp.]|uniref:TusE/DsrC/DsvC family sulfur relay protein n=1 Tax=Marinoscillum sp. TaxID=2024838 RepID=UPI0032FF742C
METIIANMPVNVNEQGYLLDMNQWNKEIAEQIADEEAIDLTNRHWEVLEYLRAEQVKGTALSIRKIGKSGVVGIAEFYKLFPEGPLKKASRIAGIPKPASCI